MNTSHSIMDLKFLNYNVNGLLQKLDHSDFIYYIQSHDFICLTETFVPTKFESDLFNDFLIFTSKASKLSHHGRHSGGVIVLIKKTLSPFVKQITVSIEHTIVVKLDKTYFGTAKDVMCICSYIHPQDSKYWGNKQDGYGLELLESCYLQLQEMFDDFYVLIMGDFNARTADGNYCYVDSDFSASLVYTDSDFPRKSLDKCSNTFGEQLLELCSMFDSVILNGLCAQNLDGSFTYLCGSGCSVVDYFIMSIELFVSLHDVSLDVQSETESDHLPVVLTCTFRDSTLAEEKQNEKTRADSVNITGEA